MLASSVGVVMPRSFRVVGPHGMPAAAWVAFVHEGNHIHYAASLAWRQPGGLLKSDSSGVVELPMVIYLKPPLEVWVRHKVQTIFVPALHATIHGHSPAEGETIRVPDHTGDPVAWDHAFGELYALVAHGLAPGGHRLYAVGPDMARALARVVVEDYHALLATHGERRREIPGEIPGHLQFASEEDQVEWRERMRREIELEPTWGIYLERRYASRIAELQDRFGL